MESRKRLTQSGSSGVFFDKIGKTIIKAYEKAQQSGLYDNVLRRDWAGKYEDYDMGKKKKRKKKKERIKMEASSSVNCRCHCFVSVFYP